MLLQGPVVLAGLIPRLTCNREIQEIAMKLTRLMVIVSHALIGWALSAAILVIGFATVPWLDALLIHALVAPIIFIYVSIYYFETYSYTTRLETAALFTLIFMVMEFVVFGLLINHSFRMFGSLLRTWIPFILIFTATHMTGLYALIMPRRRLFAR
jgi:hypothetical protein